MPAHHKSYQTRDRWPALVTFAPIYAAGTQQPSSFYLRASRMTYGAGCGRDETHGRGGTGPCGAQFHRGTTSQRSVASCRRRARPRGLRRHLLICYLFDVDAFVRRRWHQMCAPRRRHIRGNYRQNASFYSRKRDRHRCTVYGPSTVFCAGSFPSTHTLTHGHAV